jgi:hypothetical protein
MLREILGTSLSEFGRRHGLGATTVSVQLKNGFCLWPQKRKGKRAEHPLYKAWTAMNWRCNPKNKRRDWVDRGITVCGRWRDFALFVADMGPKPDPSWSLDRIDNDGNYEPGNCRWAPRSVQSRNRRPFKTKKAKEAG